MRLVYAAIACVLLCCDGQAQGKSSRPKSEPKKKSAVVQETIVRQPDFSKEFMLLSRKAFRSLENLNESFWDTLDSEVSWTPRVVAAENARDELELVAVTQVEKRVLARIKIKLSLVTTSRSLIKISERMSVRTGNYDHYNSAVEDAKRGLKKIFEDPCYLADKEAVSTGVFVDPEICGVGLGQGPKVEGLKELQKP